MSVTKVYVNGVWTGKWIARVVPERGSVCRLNKTFDRKGDATKWEAKTRAELAAGTHVDARTSPTVAAYTRDYLTWKARRPSTLAHLESMLTYHVEGTALGGRRIADVRFSQAQAWVTDRGKVLQPGSVRNLVTFLRAVFAVAVRDGLTARNPFVGVVTEKVAKARLSVLSLDEVAALVAAMEKVRPALAALVYAGSRLGLRPGELLSLRVGTDVDFLRREVHVTEQHPAGSVKRSQPKTATSTRTLVLPDDVAEVLSEHLRRFPPLADGTIFHTDTGAVYRNQSLCRYFRQAVELAGVEQRNAHGWTPHDLRHHTASVWLAAGKSPMEVAELLGHANVALVHEVYGHLMPCSPEQRRQAADEVWEWTQAQATAARLRSVH